ncbi:hypothetical protein KEJ17_07245 [Candidatus Bathyarchaeota archaeon]|nr:hypothetical protein [Candidatus Bathyarchaeota archaeon]
MGKIVREVYYFDEPGAQNTEDVLEAVMKYLKVNEIEYLIIASTSGKTALKFAEALKNKKIKVICVSEPPSRKIFGDQWPCINPETKNKLEALGADVIDRIPYKFHDSVLELAKWYVPIAEHIVGDTLAVVGGQGLKVAVEAMFMAVQAGCVEPDKEVIAVAGYGGGADTAIVVKTCFPETLFSSSPEKRLEVREILAMARKKKWWKWDERSYLTKTEA